ncbi:hypothetical protein [Herbiconiux daphne]|uniref:ABC transporter permease n=1 Tax=Herbiconiux daphne TaxID=2970914 RepID=A0ABT2H9I4_9MICO|nr:hypothetical protein [Herbiconiux daphne]MCS5736605.1 hypothetical protein [Herbiconiux daphne]
MAYLKDLFTAYDWSGFAFEEYRMAGLIVLSFLVPVAIGAVGLTFIESRRKG